MSRKFNFVYHCPEDFKLPFWELAGDVEKWRNKSVWLMESISHHGNPICSLLWWNCRNPLLVCLFLKKHDVNLNPSFFFFSPKFWAVKNCGSWLNQTSLIAETIGHWTFRTWLIMQWITDQMYSEQSTSQTLSAFFVPDERFSSQSFVFLSFLIPLLIE